MAGQKGSAFLVKIVNPDNSSPSEFVNVGGFRTKSLKINQGMVDATNQDSSNRWRELLEGGGVRSVSVSGSGVFTDSVGEGYLQDAIASGINPELQITVPGLGTFTGKFHISELSYEGPHDNAATYSFSAESAEELLISIS